MCHTCSPSIDCDTDRNSPFLMHLHSRMVLLMRRNSESSYDRFGTLVRRLPISNLARQTSPILLYHRRPTWCPTSCGQPSTLRHFPRPSPPLPSREPPLFCLSPYPMPQDRLLSSTFLHRCEAPYNPRNSCTHPAHSRLLRIP